MIKYTLALVASLFIVALSPQAMAQSTAQAGSQSASGSIAASSGNQVILQSGGKTEVSGTSTVRTAPSLGGLALGSGHPCAYSPSSAQFSVIGGGAGYGAMKVDSACLLLLQSVAANDPRAYQAAMYMIAARDPDACTAMQAAGMVKCGDSGVTSQGASAKVSSRSPEPATAPKLFNKCYHDTNKNQIMVTYTSAGRKDKARAAAACQRSLGF